MSSDKTSRESTQEIEYHENPYFYDQRHAAVWVKTWTSSGIDSVPPLGVPVTCIICGRGRGY